MSWFKKKKNEEEAEAKRTPQPVKAGDDSGSNVNVGDHNDPNRIAVMKSSYKGIPDRDFKFAINESLMSVVYTDDTGYIDEYLTGNVQPSNYWEKKFLGYKKKEVTVLSFSDQTIEIVCPATIRAPGEDIDGTVRGGFHIEKGNPRSIASILESTCAKETDKLDVKRKYITAEDLETIIRTEMQDVIRSTLYRDEIYKDTDELERVLKEKVDDDQFFLDRSIQASYIRIRFDRTAIEKINDKELQHSILMKEATMEDEIRRKAINIAKKDSDEIKKLESAADEPKKI